MIRIFAATILLVLAMGSMDRDAAGFWYYLAPFMVLSAVALIVDAARSRR